MAFSLIKKITSLNAKPKAKQIKNQTKTKQNKKPNFQATKKTKNPKYTNTSPWTNTETQHRSTCPLPIQPPSYPCDLAWCKNSFACTSFQGVWFEWLTSPRQFYLLAPLAWPYTFGFVILTQL